MSDSEWRQAEDAEETTKEMVALATANFIIIFISCWSVMDWMIMDIDCINHATEMN